jgi:hypothetical protein
MDLSTVEIDREEARARLAEYEQAAREERNAEDEAIAAGYRAAARGLPVISLQRTITAGGWHDNGFPRIAVIRAGAQECFAHWSGSDVIFADRDDRNANRGALVGVHSVRVPIPGDDRPAWRPGSWQAASTIVPLIPPRFRPRPRRLRHCHILWEVEEWTRVPPRDPALLRHIRGDLWAVLAVWDLSELERLVLAQRA